MTKTNTQTIKTATFELWRYQTLNSKGNTTVQWHIRNIETGISLGWRKTKTSAIEAIEGYNARHISGNY